jgi:hypothetical protein
MGPCVFAVATVPSFIPHVAIGQAARYLSDHWACVSAGKELPRPRLEGGVAV